MAVNIATQFISPESIPRFRSSFEPPGVVPGWFVCADEVLIRSTFVSRALLWRCGADYILNFDGVVREDLNC